MRTWPKSWQKCFGKFCSFVRASNVSICNIWGFSFWRWKSVGNKVVELVIFSVDIEPVAWARISFVDIHLPCFLEHFYRILDAIWSSSLFSNFQYLPCIFSKSSDIFLDLWWKISCRVVRTALLLSRGALWENSSSENFFYLGLWSKIIRIDWEVFLAVLSNMHSICAGEKLAEVKFSSWKNGSFILFSNFEPKGFLPLSERLRKVCQINIMPVQRNFLEKNLEKYLSFSRLGGKTSRKFAELVLAVLATTLFNLSRELLEGKSLFSKKCQLFIPEHQQKTSDSRQKRIGRVVQTTIYVSMGSILENKFFLQRLIKFPETLRENFLDSRWKKLVRKLAFSARRGSKRVFFPQNDNVAVQFGISSETFWESRQKKFDWVVEMVFYLSRRSISGKILRKNKNIPIFLNFSR